MYENGRKADRLKVRISTGIDHKKSLRGYPGRLLNPNGFGLLLELFGQELFKVFTLHIVGFEEGANFALHVALAGPFDAVGKAILDRGLAAGLLGGGNRFFGEREVGSFKLEIGDDFLNVSDGFLSLFLKFLLLTLQVSVKFLEIIRHFYPPS